MTLIQNITSHPQRKLLKSRPDVINYILKLSHNYVDDHLVLPILSNFLSTISRLNILTRLDLTNWNTLEHRELIYDCLVSSLDLNLDLLCLTRFLPGDDEVRC